MRRRQLLAALAAGTATVAGCSSGGGDDGDVDPGADDPWTDGTPTARDGTPHSDDGPADTTDPDDADDAPDLALGEASVVDLDTGDRTLALAPPTSRSDDGAEVRVRFVAAATADHPALVRATLTNGTEYANTFRLRETPPFGPESALVAGDGEGGVGPVRHLVPTDGHDLVEASAAVERGPDGFWRLRNGAPSSEPARVRLRPGESLTGEFALVGPPGERGFPTGYYEGGTRENGLRVTAWRTSAPGPAGDSRFAGVSVPDLPGQDDTAWYHAAGSGTEGYLQPATEHATLPVDLSLTLRNHARDPLSGAHRTVYKLVDGEWYDVGPRAFTAILYVVAPGGRREFGLRAATCSDPGEGVLSLGGGRYAVDAMFGYDEGSAATAATAALVDLEGDRLSLSPTPGATVERDGSTVRVTTPAREDAERATLTVTRAGDATGADRVIAEQLHRRWNVALRDGLAPFRAGPGTERVVVETDEYAVDSAFGVGGDDRGSRTVRYRGEAFAVVLGEPS